MKRFLILWRKEVATYFLSPIGYIVMIFFLVVMGFSFWLLVNVLSQGTEGGAVMNELFGSISSPQLGHSIRYALPHAGQLLSFELSFSCPQAKHIQPR